MSTVQQEMALVERRRVEHRRTHGCKRRCSEVEYMRALMAIGRRAIEQCETRVVSKGTVEQAYKKLEAAIRVDEGARKDAFVFALMVCAVLEPGELLVFRNFEKDYPEYSRKWINRVLKDAGATFQYQAAE